MCMMNAPKPPPPPAPPPPPPPVLDQAAPNTSTSTEGGSMQAARQGTKKYRTSLGISSDNGSVGGTGLSIAT